VGGRTVVPGGWHIVFSFEPWDWGCEYEDGMEFRDRGCLGGLKR